MNTQPVDVLAVANYPEIPEGSFSESDSAYLSELAAEIVASGNPHGDLFNEMQAAHVRRRAFAMEMAKGATDRAQKVRAVICAKVYGGLVARASIRSTFDRMQMQADESYRLDLLSQGHDAIARVQGGAP